MNRKPSNWYEMSWDEQREWNRRERAREDAEDEARRARDDAEAANRRASRERREAQSRESGIREEMAGIQEDYGHLEETLCEVRLERDRLVDVCKNLLCFVNEEGEGGIADARRSACAAARQAIEEAKS